MSLFSYEWLRQEREKKEHPEQYQAATLPRVLALANLEMQPGSEENSTRLQGKNGRSCKKIWPGISTGTGLPETKGKYGSPRNSQLRNLNGKRYVAIVRNTCNQK